MARAQAVPKAVFDIDQALARRQLRRDEIPRRIQELLDEELVLAAEMDRLLDLRRAETQHP